MTTIIDLSQSISPTTRIFPGSPNVSFLKWSKYDINGYDSESIFLSTHTGTHMDAPSHFIKESQSIDIVDVSRCFMTNTHLFKISKSRNQLITEDDIINSNLSINSGDTLVLSTGWEHNYHSNDYMTANPGLSKEAAIYLANKKINAIAIDGPSIDVGNDLYYSAHRLLLQNNILIIENLCNLDILNQKTFTLIAIPLKLVAASGSPIRALAII